MGIDLNSKTFAIHGPNGSGKSGVVDAIDFALTGGIRRLEGEGTGSVSVTQHAPHVRVRTTPAAASVALTVKDVATGKTSVLTRSVKTPRRFSLTPDDPAVRQALLQAQQHPELTLSRREIIQYVVSQPTTRATQIQALLKLDKLGTLRKNLSSANGKAAAEVSIQETALSRAETSLKTYLNTDSIDPDVVLESINKKRRTLEAVELTTLNSSTDFMEGITATAGTQAVNLAAAISDVGSLETLLGDLSSVDEKRKALYEAIAAAGNGIELATAITRRTLLSSGVANVKDKNCPFCGHEWESLEALRQHIELEIKASDDARKQVLTLEEPRVNYVNALADLRAAGIKIVATVKEHGGRELPIQLSTWTDALATHGQDFSTNEKALSSADELGVRQYDAPSALKENLTALSGKLAALPDQSATVGARTFLVRATDQWDSVVLTRKDFEAAKAVNDVAKQVYELYCETMDDALETLYRTVEQDFSRYYRTINADDEGDFSARLTPSQGSLDLAVDFYGIDMFPPNAYHSEGHQDGMGVCLYLALMKQRLGSDFRLAVFDDVVMSVDANHRRQFCTLLRTEFPDVQFIITTHDQVWARQMESAGLITRKQQARFYGWTVDDGPLSEQVDVWNRINLDLNSGDINGAAHKLRRHLEASTADIAEAIGGKVTFRGDGNYGLGDFLSAVKSRHGDLLKLAAASASSWGFEEKQAEIEEKKKARAVAILEHDKENWAVNVLVHQNDWASMTKEDFLPVLESSKQFLDLFTCEKPECTGWIKASGFSPESLNCDCHTYSVNLKKKPSN